MAWGERLHLQASRCWSREVFGDVRHILRNIHEFTVRTTVIQRPSNSERQKRIVRKICTVSTVATRSQESCDDRVVKAQPLRMRTIATCRFPPPGYGYGGSANRLRRPSTFGIIRGCDVDLHPLFMAVPGSGLPPKGQTWRLLLLCAPLTRPVSKKSWPTPCLLEHQSSRTW